MFGFLSADLYSGLDHPSQAAFRDCCGGEGEQPACPGHGPQRGFTHIMARGSDAVSSAKENSLADFLEMALDLLKPFQLESNTPNDIHGVSLQE